MNSFEPLFWMGCAWLLIRIVRTGDARLWIWFGVVAGLGLENKYSMGLFGFALLAGLVLSGRYRLFASRWFWIGGAIAFSYLPAQPCLEHRPPFPVPRTPAEHQAQRPRRGSLAAPLSYSGTIGYVAAQPAHLACRPLVLFLQSRTGRTYRFLGWTFVITAGVIMFLSPRIYYLFPAFPVVFAGGAVLWEQLLRICRPGIRKGALILNGIWITAMILAGTALAPIVLPVLSPEETIQYMKITHQEQPRIENHKLGPLPQLFADQFGWPEMAATVASVY